MLAARVVSMLALRVKLASKINPAIIATEYL
jgi:hypothetical protein